MGYEKIIFEKIAKITIIIEPTPEPPIEPEYTLDILIKGSGTTEPATQIKYHVGDKIIINAIPAEGWLFKDWTYSWIPDLHTTENPLSLTLSD